MIQRHVVTVTTNAGGDGTGYTDNPVHGLVHAVRYVKNNYTDGIDVTITGELSGIAVLAVTNMNATATYQPRSATVDNVAAASLYAVGGEPVEDRVPVAMERIMVVVAQGGASTTGTFHIFVEV
jgi:hypothetical protein